MCSQKEPLGRVLMIFSNSYDGAYPRDLAHGFFDAGIEIGFISLSKASIPQWISNHFAKDFSCNQVRSVLNALDFI